MDNLAAGFKTFFVYISNPALVTTVAKAIYGLRNDLILRLSNGQSFVGLLISALSFRSWSVLGFRQLKRILRGRTRGACANEVPFIFQAAPIHLNCCGENTVMPRPLLRIGDEALAVVAHRQNRNRFGAIRLCAFYPFNTGGIPRAKRPQGLTDCGKGLHMSFVSEPDFTVAD